MWPIAVDSRAPGLLPHGPPCCLIGSNLSGSKHGFFWLVTGSIGFCWGENHPAPVACIPSLVRVVSGGSRVWGRLSHLHTCPFFTCWAAIWPGSWCQSGIIKTSEVTNSQGIGAQCRSRVMDSLNVISLLCLLCTFHWKAYVYCVRSCFLLKPCKYLFI